MNPCAECGTTQPLRNVSDVARWVVTDDSSGNPVWVCEPCHAKRPATMRVRPLTQFENETLDFHADRLSSFRSNLEHHRRCHDDFARQLERDQLDDVERAYVAAKLAKMERLIAECEHAIACYADEAEAFRRQVTS